LFWRFLVNDAMQYSHARMQHSARISAQRRPYRKLGGGAGLLHANIIKTGERTYCIIAEWVDMDSLANARPNMIATLDTFRDTLEDLGGGLGVTDPVSGPVVLALK
jgi:hypothetical protein